jgi:hypothetical protein
MSRLSAREQARLTALLTECDPAVDAPPAPARMRQLRARVLDAARLPIAGRVPSVPFAVRFSLAVVCLGVVSLAIYIGSAVWVVPAIPPRPNSPPPLVAETRPKAEAPADAGQLATVPRRARQPREARMVASVPVPSPVTAPEARSAAAFAGDQERPRQVHFVAPGGTRIVWTIQARSTAPRLIQQQEEPRCGAN